MTGAETARSSSGVVVGVDGSDNARSAAEWAAQEALVRGVPLTLVCALRARENGRAIIDRVAAHLRGLLPGLRVETVLSDLPPAHALREQSQNHSLLVTGTRGHGGFPGTSLGSVSRKLAAHADCPVVVVPDRHGPQGPTNEVVVGVEPGQADAPMEFAFATAERYGASLQAARALWPRRPWRGPGDRVSPRPGRTRDPAAAVAEDILAPFRHSHPTVDVGIVSRRGNTVPILVEAARDTRLLVVGAHRHRGPLGMSAGYVVAGVLAHSETPVAVVPIRPPTVEERAEDPVPSRAAGSPSTSRLAGGVG